MPKWGNISYMLNSPNSLSFLRAPLAFLFIIENTPFRVIIVVLAMLSDCVDGYLARRYHFVSRFGAVLDPVMDKLFVYVTLSVLFLEKQIAFWQIATLLSRDFFLLIFLSYLGVTGNWKNLEIRAIRWGKVTTGSQFFLLIALVLNLSISSPFYYLFVLFGCFSFIELLLFKKKPSSV